MPTLCCFERLGYGLCKVLFTEPSQTAKGKIIYCSIMLCRLLLLFPTFSGTDDIHNISPCLSEHSFQDNPGGLPQEHTCRQTLVILTANHFHASVAGLGYDSPVLRNTRTFNWM